MAQIIYTQLKEQPNSNKKNKNDSKCPFCNYHNKKNLLIHEGNTCYILANKYPYLYGHLLIVPKRHITNILELNKDEDKDVMLLIKRAIKLLSETFNPTDFDIGYQTPKNNIEHIHFHVVPKFKNDDGIINLYHNNFISEKPEEMVKKLKRKNHIFR